ncbi:flagellar protein FlgN [Piscibacillus halophilus]|uniref:FlgN protein n=1 Tax=Piscibacillus halophilus TaxID=571933 RepID=A0A1H9EI53_9BACI|nr:flagellar protein FlgN [Piscibacillus halophilus]SEQ25404.1 FlgN protein [Piscibacillus halophilus]
MTIQAIIEHLEKLYQLNESLLAISKDKTELVKKSQIEEFNELLMKERKHVQAIDQLEEKRVRLTEEWFKKHAPDASEQTISQLVELTDDAESKEKLEAVYQRLIMNLASLKQQEDLNRELIQQSLQFIELSLEMYEPQSKQINYDQTKKSTNQRTQTSMFDSKA